MTFDLRQYQTDAIQKVREQMHEHKRTMLYSPTGSGKTEIGMSIIKSALAKNKRVAFICNRIGLVTQASKRFIQSNILHGIIQGNNTHHIRRDVVICSIKTIARRKYPLDVDLVVIDEAHGCMSKEYLKFIESYNNIPMIGLSATPFTKGLGKKNTWGKPFENMVCAITIRDLISQGYLVDCDIYAPSEPDLTGVKIVRGDYDERQLGIAVDKPRLVGDIVQHWNRLANGLPTVCFGTNIAHSKHIMEEFLAEGISAEHIDCFTDDEDRAAILKRHQDGITTVLCNVSVLAEGWDSPVTSCMILARPTRSLTRYIQMVGRALRPYQGKNKALVLDHSGTCYRLGFPTDDLPLELDDGTKQESKDLLPQERKPHVCPNCHFLVPPGIGACPKCGCVPQRSNKVESEDGELTKVERKEKYTAEQKQELWSSALGLAQKRKKSDGWASHLYRSMTGVWPRGLNDVTCEPIKKVLDMDTHNRIAYAKSKNKRKIP